MKLRKTKRQINEERKEQQKLESLNKKKKTVSNINKTVKPTFTTYIPPPRKNVIDTPYIPSYNNGVTPVQLKSEKIIYEDEMAIREQEAQREIERKKKRVAILCPKSTYQYITDGIDIKEIGRKNPL